MRVVDKAVGAGRRTTRTAWHVSAAPVQLLGRRLPDQGTVPFYALAATTAAVGLVDWPVALLVAGAVLSPGAPPRPRRLR